MNKEQRIWVILAVVAFAVISGYAVYASLPASTSHQPGMVVDHHPALSQLDSTDPVPPPPPAPPPIEWYPRGIGLPLGSEDPRSEDLRVAMLTFDDGPDQHYTAAVLDVLKEKQVRAIFFITGYGAKHEDLLYRIHEDGHILAVHGMTHANLTRIPVEQIREEMAPLVTIIQDVTGEAPRYFRPPYGAYNANVRAVAEELGLLLVNWTNGSLDWFGVDVDGYKDPQIVVNDVMEQLHRGAVILMHDNKRHTLEALPTIIDLIRAEDYEFVTLP